MTWTILHMHRALLLMSTHTDNEDHVFTATCGHTHSFLSQRAPNMGVTTGCLQRRATATTALEFRAQVWKHHSPTPSLLRVSHSVTAAHTNYLLGSPKNDPHKSYASAKNRSTPRNKSLGTHTHTQNLKMVTDHKRPTYSTQACTHIDTWPDMGTSQPHAHTQTEDPHSLIQQIGFECLQCDLT